MGVSLDELKQQLEEREKEVQALKAAVRNAEVRATEGIAKAAVEASELRRKVASLEGQLLEAQRVAKEERARTEAAISKAAVAHVNAAGPSAAILVRLNSELDETKKELEEQKALLILAEAEKQRLREALEHAKNEGEMDKLTATSKTQAQVETKALTGSSGSYATTAKMAVAPDPSPKAQEPKKTDTKKAHEVRANEALALKQALFGQPSAKEKQAKDGQDEAVSEKTSAKESQKEKMEDKSAQDDAAAAKNAQRELILKAKTEAKQKEFEEHQRQEERRLAEQRRLRKKKEEEERKEREQEERDREQQRLEDELREARRAQERAAAEAKAEELRKRKVQKAKELKQRLEEEQNRLEHEKATLPPEDFQALQLLRAEAVQTQPEEEFSPDEFGDLDEDELLDLEIMRAKREEQALVLGKQATSTKGVPNIMEMLMKAEGMPVLGEEALQKVAASQKAQQRAALKQKLQERREIANMTAGIRSGRRV